MVASSGSVSLRRRVLALLGGLVLAAGGAAGRRVRVLDIRRVTAAGIMGAYSRRRPGSIAFSHMADSGVMPREVRLSGLAWRQLSRRARNPNKTRTTKPEPNPNNRGLARQANYAA